VLRRWRCCWLPVLLQYMGNFWVRIADFALLYVLLALGLNIVVGYAGLLDLGFVAFFAIGAYMYGLMASPHLSENFAWFARMFPNGLHASIWLVVPLGAFVAGVFGILLGAPTLKLRGDYLAIVTLGFGEIIRVFLNNLDHPVNITNGPKGLNQIDSFRSWLRAQPGQAAGHRRLHHQLGHAVLLPVPGLVVAAWSSATGSRCRASAAPGWPSARTRSPPRPWASTPAT
jgi:ABC-type branched-subunit amino acid transport system permease subunit